MPMDAISSNSTDPAEWGRYVFVERPRCPKCGSTVLKTRHSRREFGDGSITRDTVCRTCGATFFVVVE